MQRSSVLLIEGIDVGSFTEQEVHHLAQTRRGRRSVSLHVWVPASRGPATDDGPYLGVAIEGSVVQRSAPTAVRHVDAAQERDDHLGTAQSVVGRGDVQRRLPVLVSRVHVGRVVNQNSDRLLR